MGWPSISMSLLRDSDPNECKNFIRNRNGSDSAELNLFSYNGSFTLFDLRSLQVQTEKKQTTFIVTQQSTVHTGVLTYQPIF